MATSSEINALYQDLFGRDADTGGLQYWTDYSAQNNISADNLAQYLTGAASAEDKAAYADDAQYSTAWNDNLDANLAATTYDAAQDKWVVQNPVKTASTASGHGAYREPAAYQQLSNGDYDAWQKAIYDGSVAGLQEQETKWRDQSNQSLSNRGLWSSGIAERAQNDITNQLGDAYAQAGANAANSRYGMQAQDLNNLNNYNLQSANAYNNYQLGYGNYTNALQSINDNYALQRAQMLNEANANASNAAWQAQWTPANYLAGIYNGTGGVFSSSNPTDGGWNFKI